MRDHIAELMERWLPEYGVRADAATRERLGRYLERVRQAQKRVRLVGSAEPEVLVRRHLGESLALGRLRPLGAERLVDVGSGAGFPGLALALVHTELKTTLVESTRKKADFLREAVSGLGIEERVEVWGGYLERRPRGGRAPLLGAQLVTVRALERMEEVPEWLWRWLDPGTEVAFWITHKRAEMWRAEGRRWSWGEWLVMPDSVGRGIQVAVPRETSAGGEGRR